MNTPPDSEYASSPTHPPTRPYSPALSSSSPSPNRFFPPSSRSSSQQRFSSPPARRPPSPPLYHTPPNRADSSLDDKRAVLRSLEGRWILADLDRVAQSSTLVLLSAGAMLPLGLCVISRGLAKTPSNLTLEPGDVVYQTPSTLCATTTAAEVLHVSEGAFKLAVLRPLGRGRFGQVSLLRHPLSGQLFAGKACLDPSDAVQRSVLDREAQILMRLRGQPFVVGFFGPLDASGTLLLEFLPGGELLTLLSRRGKSLSPDAQRFYLGCLASALASIHACRVLYRDLKPENCMVDQLGYLRLVDFGMAKHLAESEPYATTMCGTPDYFSPELALGLPYSFPSDCWALGCLFFEVVAGFPPFADQASQLDANLLNRICNDSVAFPEDWVDDDLAMLVLDLMAKDPDLRPSAAQVKSHAWFSGFDWIALETFALEPPPSV